MSFAIPVKRLRETPNLIAFQHPSPSYKFHLLIVPKRQAKTLAELDRKIPPSSLTYIPPCKAS
jgi:diadenosine tetraphosphate (Ap4A) HIT family hydrolase